MFEIGNTYSLNDGKIEEISKLSGVISGQRRLERWSKIGKDSNLNYYQAIIQVSSWRVGRFSLPETSPSSQDSRVKITEALQQATTLLTDAGVADADAQALEVVGAEVSNGVPQAVVSAMAAAFF